MAVTAVIFDLDETLMPEHSAVKAAFEEACEPVVAQYGVAAAGLADAFLRHGRELWRTSPSHSWCLEIGISSWEGLSGDFGGDGEELSALREWIEKSQYRSNAWRRALGEFGIDDEPLAEGLVRRVVDIRRKHHSVYPETRGVLESLQGRFRLALLTNGAPRIQREKLRGAGLERYFDSVIVSGEVGIGKPDPRAFELMLAGLGVEASATVMIGDSLRNDIAGAQQAGIKAIWINRAGRDAPDKIQPDATIQSLGDIHRALGRLSTTGPEIA